MVHNGLPVVADACFARQTVSWLIDGSVYQMNGSHYVTQQFYENVNNCAMEIVASNSVQRVTADPKNCTSFAINSQIIDTDVSSTVRDALQKLVAGWRVPTEKTNITVEKIYSTI